MVTQSPDVRAAPHILAFAGSLRRDARDRDLLEVAVAGARAAGGLVTVIDLAEFSLPLYDGPLASASDLPAAALRLHQLVGGHRALLVASPEFNGSWAPAVKNALDWVAEVDTASSQGNVFASKVVSLVGTSSGSGGGLAGLAALSNVLGYLGMVVAPMMVGIARANEAFEASGGLRDKNLEARVRGVGGALVSLASSLT